MILIVMPGSFRRAARVERRFSDGDDVSNLMPNGCRGEGAASYRRMVI
jgi:hypothetical protein